MNAFLESLTIGGYARAFVLAIVVGFGLTLAHFAAKAVIAVFRPDKRP